MPADGLQDKNWQRGSNGGKRPFDIEYLLAAKLHADSAADPEEFEDRPHRDHQQQAKRDLRGSWSGQPIPDPPHCACSGCAYTVHDGPGKCHWDLSSVSQKALLRRACPRTVKALSLP